MCRTYRVRYEFRNEHGGWVPDVLDNNGGGFSFREADALKTQLAERESVKNVRIEGMSEIRHW